MAEDSMLWTTSGTGDGAAGGYTMNEWRYMLRSLFLRDMATMGVAYGYGNALEVTNPSGRDLQVNTGAAIVAGFPYWNTSAVTKTLTLPVIGTTGWRMVLRADWAAQTVRITLKKSADGVPTIPSLTQTDGATYEIGLAYGTITTGGVVSLTDERIFLTFNMRLNANSQGRATIQDGFFDDATVLAKFSTDSFTNAVLLQVIKDGAFQANAATRALFGAGIWTAAQIADRTRTLFVPCIGQTVSGSSAPRTVDNGWLMADTVSTYAFGEFYIPSDYASGMTVVAVIHTPSAGNAYLTHTAYYAAPGEAYNAASTVSAASAVALLADKLTEVKPLTLSGIAAGDYVTLKLLREGGNAKDTVNNSVYLKGWLVSYTADM